MSFERPIELQQALEILKDSSACVIAGGTDVFPSAGQGPLPRAFLDVTQIAGLSLISRDDNATRFGATTTWSDIIRADLPPAFDALKQAARAVGSAQIQNAGTLAGNLCNASPAADGVPPLLALDAKVEIASIGRGTRLSELSDFIRGVRQTTLQPDELVTAILVPHQAEGTESAFEKLGSRRYLVISISMTAANILMGADGLIAEARVAVGSCSAVAQRLPALEHDLVGQRLEDIRVSTHHLAPLSPIDDVRGTGAYRLEAAAEQCKRAILKAGRA